MTATHIPRILLLLIAIGSGAGLLHAQPVDRAAETTFSRGMDLFNDGLFARSIDAFETLTASNPDHVRTVDALYYMAEAHLALGHEGEAIRLLEVFDTNYPRHPFAFGTRLALGKYFFDRGEHDRAYELLSGVLERSPSRESSAVALYWMAESRSAEGNVNEARNLFDRIVQDFPDTDAAPRAAYAAALIDIDEQLFTSAARRFEDLARMFPQSEYTRNMGLALAETYYEISDYRRAADEILRQRPYLDGEAFDRATFLLAESYNQLGRHEDAIISYRYFTEERPESPYYRRALYGLAWNYHHQETWQWAADNFRRVHETGSDDLAASAMYHEAVNLRLARQDREALRTFERYVTNWPEHILADRGWFELGVLRYQRRDWSGARDALGVFLDDFRESDVRGDALMHLGNTNIALGDFDAALTAFDMAIALDAAPAELRERIIFQKAWLLYRNRDYRKASEEFLALHEANNTSKAADQSLFWAAESYFQLEQFDLAGTLFERYLKEYPGAEQVDAAHYALGWTYFRQGRYADAIPQFETFLDAYRRVGDTVPYRSDAMLRLADSYFALKQYPQAVRVYGRLAAEGDDYALFQIGQAYSNAGDALEAISTFQQLIDDYPFSEWREEARYQLGYLYFLNQEYELAVDSYRALKESFPTDPLAAKAQYGIGDSFFNAGRTDDAVRAYMTVLRDYPNSPFTADAASGIQFALLASGDVDRSDAIIDSLADAHAGSALAEELRFRQAETRYQSGLSDRALTDFESLLSDGVSAGKRADVFWYIGLIHRDAGRLNAAMEAFRAGLDVSQDQRRSELAYALGSLQLETQDFEDALTSFDIMERATPPGTNERAQALYGRSRALSGLGRSDEARGLLEAVTETAPDSPASYPALLGLARIHLESGNAMEALPLLEQVYRGARDATGAEALFVLGELYFSEGDVARSAEVLSRMSTLFPGYPEWMARSLGLQGRAFEQMDNPGEALRIYRELVSTYPDSPVAEHARQRIDDLEVE
ncbi:MAG: hypothetical protein COV99_07540 [Bacteroidetes bacterium CG12_big_fil_rev_8_21_14_0_65_60_17]|nr:MAG: hypothetical protein COV99_07540 [Bacteroidetes bacterium CG12_big_fil_rev_8_21_14_0_65_60_17]